MDIYSRLSCEKDLASFFLLFRVSLLLIPTPVLQKNFSGAYLGREAMMQWCVKRSVDIVWFQCLY